MHDLFSNIDPLYVISGILVGGLVGFTGVGGGSLMTPILILVFGIHPATAVGTDLLYAAATKTGGTVVHGWNRTIDWKVVGKLALGSVPMTALTVLALYYLGVDSKAVQGIITKTLGVALLVDRGPALPAQAADEMVRREGRRAEPRARDKAHHRSPARSSACW